MQILSEGIEIITRRSEAIKDKLFNAPEVATLVRHATNNEHWGPSGTQMRQIADASDQYQQCQIVFQTIWERFNEKPTLGLGSNWRNIYKALLVLDYLIKNGSERCVNEARQNMIELKELTRYHHIDTDGTDRGLSIKERAKQVVDLLSDTKKLRNERKKARASRGKFEVSMGSGYGGGSSDPWERRERRDADRFHRGSSTGYADDSDPEDRSEEDFNVRDNNTSPKTSSKKENDNWQPFSSQNDEEDWGDFTQAPSPAGPVTMNNNLSSLSTNSSGSGFGQMQSNNASSLGSLGGFGGPSLINTSTPVSQVNMNIPMIIPDNITPIQPIGITINTMTAPQLSSAPLEKQDTRSNDPWAKSHLYDLSSISAPKAELQTSTPKPLGATINTSRLPGGQLGGLPYGYGGNPTFTTNPTLGSPGMFNTAAGTGIPGYTTGYNAGYNNNTPTTGYTASGGWR